MRPVSLATPGTFTLGQYPLKGQAMNWIEEIEAKTKTCSNPDGSCVWCNEIPRLVKWIREVRPLLQRGFSGTDYARDMAKCNPQLYTDKGWPLDCGKCDTCRVRALLAEMEGE